MPVEYAFVISASNNGNLDDAHYIRASILCKFLFSTSLVFPGGLETTEAS